MAPMNPEVKDPDHGPLTLADIQKGVRMHKTRPPRNDDRDDLTAIALVIIALILIGCCCGAGIVGALWAVTG